MNAYLDERFPTLGAVAELVDGEAGRIEELKQTRLAFRTEQEAETCARRARQQEQTARRIRAAIDRDGVATTQFAPRIAEQIEDIRRLKVHERVLELAVDAATFLKDPDANAFNLASVLATLEQIGDADALAPRVHAQVIQQWWQPRMDAHCAELRAVLKAAGWPRATPTAGSATVREALQRCLEFERDGTADMQTFRVLAEPLAERVAFNFRPGKDTAREDRPEWLFGYVFRLLEPHVRWLGTDVQALVDMPLERLVRALSSETVAVLQATYVLDAHFVAELLNFADSLQTKLWVSRETVDTYIVGRIMDGTTLAEYVDSEFAERAAAIDHIASAKSGLHAIDFDADVPSAKPPFSAENAWQLVAQAVPLLALSPDTVATRLLAPLVARIFAFWDAALVSFTKAHSSLARAVGGHDADRVALPDMPDFDYLAQVLGAAAYFEVKLETLASQLEIVDSGWPIRESIAQFADIRAQAAHKLANTLVLEAQKLLRPYLQIEWREPEDHGHRLRTGVDGLRPRIDVVLRLCSSSRADRARILVAFATSLAEIVWRVIIGANVFTPSSAADLKSDLVLLWSSWSLPQVRAHARNVAAAHFLETGEQVDGLDPQEAEGLRRRRK